MSITITVAGEQITLLPSHSLFWERMHTLVVADVHLGKAATFRKWGIPIPEGCMEEDLAELTQIIHETKAQRCVIAGDLIHAKVGLTPKVIEVFQQFLNSIECDVYVICGNHDLSLVKKLPQEWIIHFYKDSLAIPPFIFKHYPEPDPNGYVWAGHLHPCYMLKDRKLHYKLPCFLVGDNVGILPAFSSFISGKSYSPSKQDRIFVVAEKTVLEV